MHDRRRRGGEQEARPDHGADAVRRMVAEADEFETRPLDTPPWLSGRIPSTWTRTRCYASELFQAVLTKTTGAAAVIAIFSGTSTGVAYFAPVPGSENPPIAAPAPTGEPRDPSDTTQSSTSAEAAPVSTARAGSAQNRQARERSGARPRQPQVELIAESVDDSGSRPAPTARSLGPPAGANDPSPTTPAEQAGPPAPEPEPAPEPAPDPEAQPTSEPSSRSGDSAPSTEPEPSSEPEPETAPEQPSAPPRPPAPSADVDDETAAETRERAEARWLGGRSAEEYEADVRNRAEAYADAYTTRWEAGRVREQDTTEPETTEPETTEPETTEPASAEAGDEPAS